jgi:hypothetical protein
MPVRFGKDKDGCYAKYGEQGAHYYYKCNSDIAKEHAKEKAIKQGIAIGDFGPIKYVKQNESNTIKFKGNMAGNQDEGIQE